MGEMACYQVDIYFPYVLDILNIISQDRCPQCHRVPPCKSASMSRQDSIIQDRRMWAEGRRGPGGGQEGARAAGGRSPASYRGQVGSHWPSDHRNYRAVIGQDSYRGPGQVYVNPADRGRPGNYAAAEVPV